MSDQDITSEPSVQATSIRRSPSIAQLALALAKAQGAMSVAAKDSKNPFFRSNYADFASVREASRKPLADNALAFTQLPRIEVQGTPEFQVKATRSGDERLVVKAMTTVYLTTILIHESGEWIENELFTVIPSADPQSIGSAVTYLRRYALAPMVGVAAANEDDDGEAAMQGNGHVAAKVQMPEGFESWVLDMEAVADEGLGPLEAAWKKSQPYFRKFLTDSNPQQWAAMKAKAAKVKEPVDA